MAFHYELSKLNGNLHNSNARMERNEIWHLNHEIPDSSKLHLGHPLKHSDYTLAHSPKATPLDNTLDLTLGGPLALSERPALSPSASPEEPG